MDITELLAFSVKNKASDLHLSSGLPPMIRVHGDVRRINLPAMEHKDVHGMVYDIMNDGQRKVYEETLECDFSFEIPNLARFRVNAFNQNWIESWQKRGWKTSDNKPVENQDLWRLLLITMRKHDVSFHKVPGHQDHAENNRCDELARSEVQKIIAQNAVMAPKAAQ